MVQNQNNPEAVQSVENAVGAGEERKEASLRF
jgi:hypothetical protein